MSSTSPPRSLHQHARFPPSANPPASNAPPRTTHAITNPTTLHPIPSTASPLHIHSDHSQPRPPLTASSSSPSSSSSFNHQSPPLLPIITSPDQRHQSPTPTTATENPKTLFTFPPLCSPKPPANSPGPSPPPLLPVSPFPSLQTTLPAKTPLKSAATPLSPLLYSQRRSASPSPQDPSDNNPQSSSRSARQQHPFPSTSTVAVQNLIVSLHHLSEDPHIEHVHHGAGFVFSHPVS